MHMNKRNLKENSSLEYYHMTCIGKQNIQAKEVRFNLFVSKFIFWGGGGGGEGGCQFEAVCLLTFPTGKGLFERLLAVGRFIECVR